MPHSAVGRLGMQRATVVLLGLGALLAACASPSPTPPTPALAVSERGADQCTLWLDPVTKNTDIVELFYRLDAAGRGTGADPAADPSDFRTLATVEMERAELQQRERGVDKVVITLPLTYTYDAARGVAQIPTEPLQGDSIFFDTVARGATNTLSSYTLVTDPTNSSNLGSYPTADAIGPPSQPRVSKGLRYGVALLDLDPRTGGWASGKGGLAVPLPQARAKEGYGRLAVKIVAELVPPGILTGQEIHPATKTTGEWEVDLRYITGRTVCAAIGTAVDGEMVRRVR